MLRVVLALMLGLGVTAGAYVAGQRLEEGVEARLFEEQVERVGQVAIARMAPALDPVEKFGLFSERREVNAATFVPELKGRHHAAPALRALAWLPVVKEREVFEKQVQRYYQGFEIREQTVEGVVQTAGPATAWVPFLLLEPEEGNDILRGLDIGNLGPLAETMQQTYMRHAPVVSPLFEFTGIDEPLILVLFYVPEPEGFAGGLIEPKQLLEYVTGGHPTGIVGRLTDDTTGKVLITETGFSEEGSLRFATSLGGRSFSLDLASGPDYQPTQVQLAVPAAVGGVGVTLLMMALSLVGGRREESAS